MIWEQHPCPDRYKEPVFREFFSEALKSGGALVAVDLKNGKNGKDGGDGEIIGSSRYYELDKTPGSVVIGYTFLKRRCWGGAYNREMKRLMTDHAFQYVDVVHFHVDETNARSRKAMEKIGGLLTGRFSKPRPDGGFRTALIYSLRSPLAAEQL